MKFAVACGLVCFLACSDNGTPGSDECGIVDEVVTIEECECIGGRVEQNSGGGARCDDDEVQVSQVTSGIEPGACCVAE